MFFSESISKMKRENEREREREVRGKSTHRRGPSDIGNKEQNIFEEAAQLTKPQHRHA